MNTIISTLVGIVFSIVLAALVSLLCWFGLAQPNYFPDQGETYLGWCLSLYGSTIAAFMLFGLTADCLGVMQIVYRYFRR